MNWNLIFLSLFLISYSNFLVAQDQEAADSLIDVIRNQELNLLEQYLAHVRLARVHPDIVEGLSYAESSLQLAQEIDSLELIAIAYEQIGMNERLLGTNASSVEAILKAMALYEAIDRQDMLASIYAQIGSNLVVDGDFMRAIDYIGKANSIEKSNGQWLRYSLNLVNLGEAYRLAKQLDSAIFHFEEALASNDTLNNQIIEGYARGNLGMALRSQGQLPEARAELNPAIAILSELGDPYSVSVYTAELAQINEVEGQEALAEQQLLKAYQMALAEGLKEQIRDFSEMLVAFYEKRGRYEEALGYQKVYQVYQDSLVNKANVQKVERLRANYEIDKREGEIDLLEEINEGHRNVNIALGSGALVFCVLAVLLYQSNRRKNEANHKLSKQKTIVMKREEEKALLLKELNHRVKNNLQMVASLLNLQENELTGHPAAEAINSGKLRVEALSMIHQKLYQDDVHTSIAIKEYLEQLISKLLYSYGDPLKPEIIIQPEDMEMDIDTAIPVSLIVNELVTNALKYAYEGIEHPEMTISLVRPNGHYTLEVSDNGVGMDHGKDNGNSFGLKLVKSLVDQMGGTLEIRNVPSGGTAWVITFTAQQGESINEEE